MITLHATMDSKMRFHKVFDRISEIVADESTDISYRLFDAALEVFTDATGEIFENEGGQKAWEQLGPRTQRERKELGYASTGPILKRTLSLFKSLTDVNFTEQTVTIPTLGGGVPIRSGNAIDVEPSMKGHTWRFGTSDERFLSLQEGTTEWPARPMVPEGVDRLAMNKDIEDVLVALIREIAHE